jgi:hypothetical protein
LVQVPAALRRHAAERGAAAKYHETLTRCWIRLVAAALERTSAPSFEALVAQHPELLDQGLPLRYYSAARLWSSDAREGDVAPDLARLPCTPGPPPGPPEGVAQSGQTSGDLT